VVAGRTANSRLNECRHLFIRLRQKKGYFSMADYHSPTVVDPVIPVADMNALERLLISNIFEYDEEGDNLYFHHWAGAESVISVNRQEFEAALANAHYDENSPLAQLVEQAKGAPALAEEIELDLSEMSFEFLFQNIIRRSSTLQYILVITSFMCTKMRFDGFGGMATVITADKIAGKSTHDIIAELLDEAGIKEL
jgi:hypothetical protein